MKIGRRSIFAAGIAAILAPLGLMAKEKEVKDVKGEPLVANFTIDEEAIKRAVMAGIIELETKTRMDRLIIREFWKQPTAHIRWDEDAQEWLPEIGPRY